MWQAHTYRMVTIRPYDPADAAAAHHILLTCIEEGGTMAMTPEHAPSVEQTAASMGRCGSYVAVDGEQVVGVVSVRPRTGTYAHTVTLSIEILPAYRGQGIGRRLMHAIIRYAFRHWERIELEVFATNERAIALYRSMGFVVEGRRRQGHNERGTYVDVVVMGLLRFEQGGSAIPQATNVA